ncbi:MAG: thiamine-phosphate kinase [Dehalococcoidales bacterium]|nr:thiamine-phosphate kinase [Dehalococcoidales bacterium]
MPVRPVAVLLLERRPDVLYFTVVKVAELGEFSLIDLLSRMITEAGVDRLGEGKPIIGIGDDAAAFRGDAGVYLATTDTMMEDVHFRRGLTGWQDLGWKALAINLSDIAAMGGIPQYVLVALALPAATEVEAVTAVYEGMIELARKSSVAIIGGNISRADKLSITITVLGISPEGKVMGRSGARAGDIIAVTGYLGSAAAGREMLYGNLALSREAGSYLREAFNRPTPRIREGNFLLKHGVSCAIDLSDGLLADLGHICEASGLGARLDITRLPVHPAVRENFGEMADGLALSGGEDYEILFTAGNGVVQRLRDEATFPLTAIGTITESFPGRIEITDAEGKPVKTARTGWTHF